MSKNSSKKSNPVSKSVSKAKQTKHIHIHVNKKVKVKNAETQVSKKFNQRQTFTQTNTEMFPIRDESKDDFDFAITLHELNSSYNKFEHLLVEMADMFFKILESHGNSSIDSYPIKRSVQKRLMLNTKDRFLKVAPLQQSTLARIIQIYNLRRKVDLDVNNFATILYSI